MQLELTFSRTFCFQPESASENDVVVQFVRHPRARHYIIRVLNERLVRVTIPRRGSQREARAFFDARQAWVSSRLDDLEARARLSVRWEFGVRVWFRGKSELLLPVPDTGRRSAQLGDLVIAVTPGAVDLQADIERAMKLVAKRELPERVAELAPPMGLQATGVTIRNQRTRWGSCSARGKLSLNWRLVQVPLPVRDYILIHELSHLRHLNHSPAFWAHVAQYCPDYQEHERWLKSHSDLTEASPA